MVASTNVIQPPCSPCYSLKQACVEKIIFDPVIEDYTIMNRVVLN